MSLVSIKEDIGEGSIHCYNVCLHLLVLRLRCTDRGATVVINTRSVVGHVGYLGQEGCKGIRVRFCGRSNIVRALSRKGLKEH